MDRRGFLGGLVSSVVGTSLVLRAEPKALELFKPVVDEPIILAPPPTLHGWDDLTQDIFLYNKHGQPVMVVKSFSMDTEVEDMTMLGDQYRQYHPNRTIHCHVTGIITGSFSTLPLAAPFTGHRRLK